MCVGAERRTGRAHVQVSLWLDRECPSEGGRDKGHEKLSRHTGSEAELESVRDFLLRGMFSVTRRARHNNVRIPFQVSARGFFQGRDCPARRLAKVGTRRFSIGGRRGSGVADSIATSASFSAHPKLEGCSHLA